MANNDPTPRPDRIDGRPVVVTETAGGVPIKEEYTQEAVTVAAGAELPEAWNADAVFRTCTWEGRVVAVSWRDDRVVQMEWRPAPSPLPGGERVGDERWLARRFNAGDYPDADGLVQEASHAVYLTDELKPEELVDADAEGETDV